MSIFATGKSPSQLLKLENEANIMTDVNNTSNSMPFIIYILIDFSIKPLTIV